MHSHFALQVPPAAHALPGGSHSSPASGLTTLPPHDEVPSPVQRQFASPSRPSVHDEPSHSSPLPRVTTPSPQRASHHRPPARQHALHPALKRRQRCCKPRKVALAIRRHCRFSYAPPLHPARRTPRV